MSLFDELGKVLGTTPGVMGLVFALGGTGVVGYKMGQNNILSPNGHDKIIAYLSTSNALMVAISQNDELRRCLTRTMANDDEFITAVANRVRRQQ